MSGPTLGDFLRAEREKRGVTLEQLASGTKINIRLLHALEANHYADLPARPFIRGYVIAYCRFVGMDATEVLARFSHYIDEKALERETLDVERTGYAFEKKDTERSRMALWIGMVGFLVLGVVSIFVLKPALRHKTVKKVEELRTVQKNKEQAAQAPAAVPTESPAPQATVVAAGVPTPPKAPAPAPVVPAPAPVPPPDATARPVEVHRQAAPDDPLNKGDTLAGSEIYQKLVIHTQGNVWIRYQVDQRPVMKLVLLTDRMIVLRAKSSIRFQVSNASVVQMRTQTERDLYPLPKSNAVLAVETSAVLSLPSTELQNTAAFFNALGPLPSAVNAQ